MDTENGRISLLWKNGAVSPMSESAAACASLGLERHFAMRSSRLSDHLTSDVPTIEYRAAVIRDAVANPEAVNCHGRLRRMSGFLRMPSSRRPNTTMSSATARSV